MKRRAPPPPPETSRNVCPKREIGETVLKTGVKYKIVTGDCLQQLKVIPNNSIQLVFSSPPYNVGKVYEKKVALTKYLEGQRRVILELCKKVSCGGSICWQVGNFVSDSAISPLDMLVHPFFEEGGMTLQRRFAWTFGHGLHCSKRFSGRYETISWYSKGDTQAPRFISPFHKAEWNRGIMEIPNVKSNHVEKTEHPCQFPVEMVERFVLALTNTGDLVLDPYSGVGSTVVAALKHDRRGIGVEIDENYVDISEHRVASFFDGSLTVRELGSSVYVPTPKDSTARRPDEWRNICNPSLKLEDEYKGSLSTHRPPDLAVFIGSTPPLDFVAPNICVVADSLTRGTIDAPINSRLRNRIICENSDGSLSCVFWFSTEEHHFDLDAVRVPSKYPGKKSVTTGLLSGNPLGKNPSDVWTDRPAATTVRGLSQHYWTRIIRSLCPVGGTVLFSSRPSDQMLQIVTQLKRCVVWK